MSDEQDPESAKTVYPAVPLIYPIALETYEWALKRYDAIDARIQTLITLWTSLTLAVPVAFSSLKLEMASSWFICAIVCFLVALGIGTHARLTGKLTMLDPSVFYDKWLDFPADDFKGNLIYFLGQHLKKNRDLIEKKHKLLVWVTVIFVLEIVLLVGAVSYRL